MTHYPHLCTIEDWLEENLIIDIYLQIISDSLPSFMYNRGLVRGEFNNTVCSTRNITYDEEIYNNHTFQKRLDCV